MPYGNPLLYGGQPSQPEPADPDNALNGIIEGFFNDARSRVNSQDFSTIFNDMLKNVQQQPAPSKLPVPAPLHPVGQLAAVFASTLAEQLGAKGAVAAHQQRAQQNVEQRQTAEQTNILRADEFERNKAKQELDIRLRISEAKAEQAKRMGQLDEYEARLKANAAIRREQLKLQEDSKLKIVEATNKAIMERVLAATKERGAQARETLNYKKLLGGALDTTKASDAVKAWARIEQGRIFSRDITGEYVYTPEQQEKMAEETYQEFLRRVADERETATGVEQPGAKGDAFDQFIETLFSE